MYVRYSYETDRDTERLSCWYFAAKTTHLIPWDVEWLYIDLHGVKYV